MSRNYRSKRGGFTLIEAALAIVIVGVGVIAAAELLAIGTRANANAHRLTTALNLAVNIREHAHDLTLDELLALNGQTFSPPRDARNQPISGLDDWQQTVTAVRANPNLLTLDAPSSDSRLIRLAVSVSYRGQHLTREEWIVASTRD